MNVKLKNILGAVGAALVLVVATVAIVRPIAISEVVGLAVAQSSTQWNSIVDGAKGDGISSGVLGEVPYLFNGSTFDRARVMSSDGVAGTGFQGIIAAVFNGSNYDRVRGGVTGDGIAGTGLLNDGGLVFNASTWDRIRAISATNNTATTSTGAIQIAPLSTWSVTNTTSGANAASASKAAGGGTVRHVATSITICYNDTAAATTALQVNLRDGATGAGTIIRSWLQAIPVAGDSKCNDLSGLNMSGSANTAMTLEFAAAGAATSAKTVTLTGYSTP